jgi:hypothetical protein
MNNFNIDRDLIHNFRRNINSKSDFVLQKYQNIDSNNYWNIIYSSMDWITIAIDNLNNITLDDQNMNKMAMQVYNFISSIDIVFESINQLHRAIIDDKILPFDGEKIIFSKNINCEDDNKYFKQLKAAFSAHPISLNDKNGKWFASWPNKPIFKSDIDFELLLYNNKTNQEVIVFGLIFTEMESFLIKRYSYLYELMIEIDKQFEEYRKIKIKEIIETDTDILKQLDILKMESLKRFNCDYYRDTIDELIRIYSNNISDTSTAIKTQEKEYKLFLVQLVNELLNKLQNMELDDLVYGKLLNPTYPQIIAYPVSKLIKCDFNSTEDPLFDHYMKELNKYSDGKYNFNSDEKKEEIFSKLKLMLYYYNN